MTPGDPNNPFRPEYYDPTQWGDHQSPVPSQDQHTEIPYRPDQLIQRLGLPGASDPNTPSGAPPTSTCPPFVRYGMDSRPPGAYDFIAPTVGVGGVPARVPSGSFTVPQGYVCIVRGFTYNQADTSITIDISGMYNSATVFFVSVAKNGQSLPGLTNIDINTCMGNSMYFPCFFIAQAGDTIQGVINGGAGFLGTQGFMFYGTMIPNDGRDVALQVANGMPEPVADYPGAQMQTSGGPGVPANATTTIPFSDPIKVVLAEGYYGPFPPLIGVNTYLDRLHNHDVYVAQVREANPPPTIVKVKRYPSDTEGV